MRVWSAVPLLLVVVALAGCTQNDPGGKGTFAVTCPNWTPDDHPIAGLTDTQLHNPQFQGQVERTSTETFPFSNGKAPAKAPADQGGKKADQYLLRFPAHQDGSPYIAVENGTLTFTIFNNDTGEQLMIYDEKDPSETARKDHWEFSSSPAGVPFVGSANLKVDLVPSTQDPRPAPIRLVATFHAAAGHIIGTGQSGTGTDRAGAVYSVEPFVSYRAAGCVKT